MKRSNKKQQRQATAERGRREAKCNDRSVDEHSEVSELVPPMNDESAAHLDPDRTGVFTSGIVSTAEGRKIAMFFTGKQHAGENLESLLEKRVEALSKPIQMCDALSRNLPKEFKTIVANCIAHARRRFVAVVDNFPEECQYVLDALRRVYKNDGAARKQNMSPLERLHYHQDNSAPIRKDLKEWISAQLDQKLVEPNSGLGEAIKYMLKHWHKLTRFLHVQRAPLDNNICERALKKAIMHRKNAMFFKTENGALVGDILMSLIYTCWLQNENPIDYLTECQLHADDVANNPKLWLPWNYRNRVAALANAQTETDSPAARAA